MSHGSSHWPKVTLGAERDFDLREGAIVQQLVSCFPLPELLENRMRHEPGKGGTGAGRWDLSLDSDFV